MKELELFSKEANVVIAPSFGKDYLRSLYKANKKTELYIARFLEYNASLQEKIIFDFDTSKIFVREYDLSIPFLDFVNSITSFCFRSRPGRKFPMLVMYDYSRDAPIILGLIMLCSPVMYGAIYEYAKRNGVKPTDMQWVNNHVVDLGVCVGTGPMTRYLSGKLLALIASSREIIDQYNSKYGTDIKALFTTSLYGKSSMYNRLRGFKYLGLSQGLSVAHLSKDQLREIKEKYENTFKRKMPRLGETGATNITYALSQLLRAKVELSFEVIKQERGIYLCEEFHTLKDNIEYWRTRWFEPRRARLTKESDRYGL